MQLWRPLHVLMTATKETCLKLLDQLVIDYRMTQTQERCIKNCSSLIKKRAWSLWKPNKLNSELTVSLNRPRESKRLLPCRRLRNEVLTAVLLRIQVLLDVMLCRLANGSRSILVPSWPRVKPTSKCQGVNHPIIQRQTPANIFQNISLLDMYVIWYTHLNRQAGE